MALSKRKMLKLWNTREELREEQAELKRRQARIDGKIMSEMEREGVDHVTIQGVPIRMTTQEPVEYDFDGLIAFLRKSKRGRTVLKRVSYTAIDKKALVQEIQAKNIPGKVVRQYSRIKPKKPYLQPGSRRKKKSEG